MAREGNPLPVFSWEYKEKIAGASWIPWNSEVRTYHSGVYSEPSQTCKVGFFAIIINGFQPVAFFTKSSILDV